MKTNGKMIQYAIGGIALLSFVTAVGNHQSVLAQESKKAKAGSSSHRGRDPFEKYKPAVKKKLGGGSSLVPVPSIQERIERYKAAKAAAMAAFKPAPKPTTALLLSEMQVTGIFRTPRGYAAMVEAMPIKLSYVIYPGESFFDGQLVAIEEDRLVFRHETRWSDGRIEKTVENKALRQANAIADSMTVSKATTSGAAPAPADAGEEKPPVPEKQ